MVACLILACAPGCTKLTTSQAQTHIPIIQAHRGAGDLSPENTMEAFELGWKLGTIPEADVRMSKDGVPVAFHDADFKRLVKDAPAELRSKGVPDLTFHELSALDVGSWKGGEFAGRRIPRIADVFAAMRRRPDRRLYLDIKEVPLEQLAGMARAQGVERQVIMASTKYEEIRTWKHLLPEAQTLHWMGGTEATLTKRLAALGQAGFADITQLQIHVMAAELSAAEPFTPSSPFLRAVAEEVHRRGIVFQTWTRGNRDPAVYGRLMDLGADSFATDDPETAMQAVRAHLQKAGHGR